MPLEQGDTPVVGPTLRPWALGLTASCLPPCVWAAWDFLPSTPHREGCTLPFHGLIGAGQEGGRLVSCPWRKNTPTRRSLPAPAPLPRTAAARTARACGHQRAPAAPPAHLPAAARPAPAYPETPSQPQCLQCRAFLQPAGPVEGPGRTCLHPRHASACTTARLLAAGGAGLQPRAAAPAGCSTTRQQHHL